MRSLLLGVSLALSACTCTKPVAPVVDAGACVCAKEELARELPKAPVRQEPTSTTPHVHPLAVCESNGKLPLDAAREAFDARQYEKALSCAAQAAALAPEDVFAHTERANALGQLERHPEATLAYARALAIDPDSLDALAGAAHFYIVLMPSSREMDELGLNYAERGFELSLAQRDDAFALSFARLSAMGFNDTGQPHDALERADWVLSREKTDAEALYERAVALFELCRFADARGAFTKLLTDEERAAWAHHHLGLLLEREGNEKEAQKHFDQARTLDAESFPEPVLLSRADFQKELDEALDRLPADMRRDLGGVPV
ncbi:MAG TPA: tetratricopeptide repeat protein, partial [Archangium sp.]